MKPNFNLMSKAELRAYVLEHREDSPEARLRQREAFEALSDRIYANPNPQWYQPEDVDSLPETLRERIVELIQSSQDERKLER
jgi:hypothetical protein